MNGFGRIPGFAPLYSIGLGDAYVADSLSLLRVLPDDSVNVVLTSPPYALHFKKAYGNADKASYVEWFLDFGREMFRVLKPDGSLVLNIGGSYNPGSPTRSLYHFKLLIELVESVGFHLAQECFWYNPAKMPMPAEWVTVRRVRVRDSVEYVWRLSKTPWPKANDPYTKRCKEAGLKIHPARFPAALPEFFLKLLGEDGDVVVDPFAGSNTTGAVAESLGMRWIAVDRVAEYLEASRFRFYS